MPRKFASQSVVATLMNVFTTTPPNTKIEAASLTERTGEPIRVVRDGIEQLIRDHSLPIVSDRNGGYVLSTRPTILLAESNRLDSQARKIGARRDALREAALRFGRGDLD